MTTTVKRAWLLATLCLLLSTSATLASTSLATKAEACPIQGCHHEPDDPDPSPPPPPPPPDMRPDVLAQINDKEVCDAPDSLRPGIINSIAANFAGKAQAGVAQLGTYTNAVQYSATCRPNQLLIGLWYGSSTTPVSQAGTSRATALTNEASIGNGYGVNLAFRTKAIRSIIKEKAQMEQIPFHRFDVPTGSVYIWDFAVEGISPNKLRVSAPVDYDTDIPFLSDHGSAVIEHTFGASGGQLQCSVSARTEEFGFLVNAVIDLFNLEKMVTKHATASLCDLTNQLPTSFETNGVTGSVSYSAVNVDADRLLVSGSISIPPIDKAMPDPASRVTPFTKGTQAGFVYRSADGHIQLVTGSLTGGLSRTDLTTATNTPAGTGDPSVYVVDGITSVVYRVAGSNRVMQLYQSGAGWWYYDLHFASGGGAPLAIGDPVGYEVNGDQFVAYKAAGNQVVRLHQYGSNGWGWTNLQWATSLTGPSAALAFSDVTPYVRNGRQHIAYRTGDNRIAQVKETSAGWVAQDLHTASGGGAPLATGDPSSYVLGVNGAVMYRTAAGDIVQMYGADGGWGWQNLHWASGGGALKAASDPTGYTLNGVTNSVIFRDTNGSVVQMYQTGAGGWAWASLQWKSGNVAPMAKGTPAGVALGGAQLVVYDGQDGRMHLLSATSAWSEQAIG